MNKEIKINFGNLIKELKDNNVRLGVFNNAILLIDNSNNIYRIELYYINSYIDKLIKNKTVVKFELDANYNKFIDRIKLKNDDYILEIISNIKYIYNI